VHQYTYDYPTHPSTTAQTGFSFIGCIKCTRCRLLLPMCAVSVSPSVSLSHSACSVRGVIWCNLCQITLVTCYNIYPISMHLSLLNTHYIYIANTTLFIVTLNIKLVRINIIKNLKIKYIYTSFRILIYFLTAKNFKVYKIKKSVFCCIF